MANDKPNTTILSSLIAALEARLGLRLSLEGRRIYIDATIGELVADQLELELGSMPDPKAGTAAKKKAPPKPAQLRDQEPAELKPEPTLETILAFIRDHGPVDGAQVKALWEGTGVDPDPRYKRDLTKLEKRGELEKLGKGRGMTYRATAPQVTEEPTEVEDAEVLEEVQELEEDEGVPEKPSWDLTEREREAAINAIMNNTVGDSKFSDFQHLWSNDEEGRREWPLYLGRIVKARR